MKLQDLYSKDITRTVNPAVSVSDLDEKTVRIEIEEYVFTDEIINGLYTILNAIKNKKVHHTGIWLNGYYGSGKSHFLKYLNYCILPNIRKEHWRVWSKLLRCMIRCDMETVRAR